MAETDTGAQQDVEEAGQNGQNAADPSRLSRLLSKDILVPAAATAATAVAAGYAAKKAPDVKKLVAGEAKQGAQELGKSGAEGAKEAVGGSPLGALAGGASKLVGRGRGGKKKTRRLPIQRWTDVAVPVEEAFEKWTNFEEFPKFMHRVVKVKQEDENRLEWEEKIWFSKRQWQGEITDRRENDRVAWKTVSGTSHSGVVSFHRLDDNLTRVLVTVDFQPAGLIEKMGSGLRFAKRAVEADLARFKAYAELGDADGLEYQAAPEQDESKEDKAKKEATSDAAGESSSRNGSSENDERDSERAREERENRRKERRGAGSR